MKYVWMCKIHGNFLLQQMASLFKSMTVRILICLEISLLLTSAMADSSTKRFCGRSLTESLALICDGEYETIIPMENKRSGKYWMSHTQQIIISLRYYHVSVGGMMLINFGDILRQYFEKSGRTLTFFLIQILWFRWILRWVYVQWPGSRNIGRIADSIPNVCLSIEAATRISWNATSCTSWLDVHSSWCLWWMLP